MYGLKRDAKQWMREKKKYTHNNQQENDTNDLHMGLPIV